MPLFLAGKRLFKGNLHLHTTFSDGLKTPKEAADIYEAAGYDFIAVTDHWKRSVDDGWHHQMLLLPGIELDCFLPTEAVHITGIAVDDSILRRVDTSASAQDLIEGIRGAGGLAYLAHPAWSLNTLATMMSFRGLSGAEVYNTVSAAPWNGDRADATQLLDVAAANGLLLNTLAVDDSHFYEGEETKSFIYLNADALDRDSVVRSLEKGDYFASQGPLFSRISFDGHRVTVQCSPVSRVLFLSNLVYSRHRCIEGEEMTAAQYRVSPNSGERFIRVVLIDREGHKAWSNPFPTL